MKNLLVLAAAIYLLLVSSHAHAKLDDGTMTLNANAELVDAFATLKSGGIDISLGISHVRKALDLASKNDTRMDVSQKLTDSQILALAKKFQTASACDSGNGWQIVVTMGSPGSRGATQTFPHSDASIAQVLSLTADCDKAGINYTIKVQQVGSAQPAKPATASPYKSASVVGHAGIITGAN